MARISKPSGGRTDELFDDLRREILAARLKVTLDSELKRPTSEMVKRLAGMKLPPLVTLSPYTQVTTRVGRPNRGGAKADQGRTSIKGTVLYSRPAAQKGTVSKDASGSRELHNAG